MEILQIADQLNAQVNIFIFNFVVYVHCHSEIDGQWQQWGGWSHCDPSCSAGRKIRARACTAPLFGGKDCVGNKTETAECQGQPFHSTFVFLTGQNLQFLLL